MGMGLVLSDKDLSVLEGMFRSNMVNPVNINFF